jgi:putative membrane protein
MLDLVLAILHHLLVFALFGVLFGEFLLVRRGIDRHVAASIASIDIWYGVLAGLILIVGFGRALFAAKGWEYYSTNGFFWAKIVTFLVIGVLSVWPTVRYIRWRRAGFAPRDADVATVRWLICLQLGLFAVLLACAAAMARGYGEF